MEELSHSQSEDDVWSQVIKNLKWKRLIINLFFTRNKKEKTDNGYSTLTLSRLL